MDTHRKISAAERSDFSRLLLTKNVLSTVFLCFGKSINVTDFGESRYREWRTTVVTLIFSFRTYSSLIYFRKFEEVRDFMFPMRLIVYLFGEVNLTHGLFPRWKEDLYERKEL